MSNLLTKITEALEDGRYYEERRDRSRFANRELPNYFDCLDGHAATGDDQGRGATATAPVNRIQKEGV